MSQSQQSGTSATTTIHGACATTKVFIQRDYSEGTAVKFHTRLPNELEGLIERPVFESTISRLNEFFAEAEKGTCSTYCEGCLACLTAYLIHMCSETHYEKTLRKISKFIAAQNERIYNPKGLQIVDPTYRGLRVIEISILDRPGRTSPISPLREKHLTSFNSNISKHVLGIKLSTNDQPPDNSPIFALMKKQEMLPRKDKS